MIKSGASSKDLFEELPQVAFKYQRGIEACAAAYAQPRDPNVAPTITILWGPSGTGKTRESVEKNPGAYIVSKPAGGDKKVWWDGYRGQSTVIIDEFYGWIPYDLLLRILDRYPLRVEYKGGSTHLSATNFWITSNKPWEEWYPNIDDISALRRRIREFGTVIHKLALEEQEDGQLGFA